MYTIVHILHKNDLVFNIIINNRAIWCTLAYNRTLQTDNNQFEVDTYYLKIVTPRKSINQYFIFTSVHTKVILDQKHLESSQHLSRF